MARGPALSPGPRLASFAPVARRRPVAIVQPGTVVPPAPYAAAEVDLAPGAPPAEVALASGPDRLAATWDGRTVALHTVLGGRSARHRSRRHGRVPDPEALAVSLTGPVVTAWARHDGTWTARAVLDLVLERGAPDVHDEEWLAALAGEGDRAGAFGQLGLRDVRAVTHADGSPYRGDDGAVLLSATSAGPGGFRTGHTSLWALDPLSLDLRHRGDLFFRRPDRPGVLGDHATHVLHDGDRWLAATSTWGDFDRRRHPRVTTTVAEVPGVGDPTRGTHVLDTAWLDLPLPHGQRSVGCWDPHLVRDPDGGWVTAFVSATRFFTFGPAVAAGPGLDRLAARAADPARTATEGVTLVRRDGRWWVLASDGRDGGADRRARYPVLDLDLREHGTLDAAYPTNLPWPTLLDLPAEAGGPLLLGFDGRPAGGRLLGYGTHGDLVLQRPTGSPQGWDGVPAPR